jgi:dTDP-3,4-didehydro-2,6-dideoxy-alpha-D-glucose 3-reductase
MKILFLGFSKFIENRVLPSLLTRSDILFDIASTTGSRNISLVGKHTAKIFDNYDSALSESNADIVYISTVNSTHAELVEKAIRKGLHVIVDKPAFINHDDALRLTSLADKSRLCLAESNIYAYHHQVEIIRDLFEQANNVPKRLVATFSFPAMNPENFRYSRKLGGGALWDLGPYAVSAGRIFFDKEPQEIIARVCSRGGKDNIDTSFCMMALYPDGHSMVGQFGFDTSYRNYLNILGSDISVSFNRVFTTPPDMENELQVQRQNTTTFMKVSSSDNFLNFLDKFIGAVETGNHGDFASSLVADSLSLKRLREAAREDRECR